MATLADLQTRIAERAQSVPFWTATEATRALNEALRVWNMLTGEWKARVVVPMVPYDPWVPLPGTIVFGFRCSWRSRPLVPTTLASLDDGVPSWRTDSTASGGRVPSRPITWAPAGLSLLAVWPSDAVGGDVLACDGIAQTPVLAAPADVLDLGDETLNVLLGYALHHLAFKEGGPRFAATIPLYQAFLKAALERNAELGESRLFRRHAGLDLRPAGARVEGAADGGR